VTAFRRVQLPSCRLSSPWLTTRPLETLRSGICRNVWYSSSRTASTRPAPRPRSAPQVPPRQSFV
jgi:hypothetical protein